MLPHRWQTEKGTPATTTQRASSLRRFGSLSSLPALHLFGRRRSNNAIDGVDSSPSSTASPSSTTPKESASKPLLAQSTSTSGRRPRFLAETVIVDTTLTQATMEPGALSKAETSLEPIPRARKTSQLPIPSRMRQPSTSQWSQKPQIEQSTIRLPSPVESNREHATTALLPTQQNKIWTKRKLPRSGTEPSLPRLTRKDSGVVQYTQQKGNIALRPVRHLTPLAVDFGACGGHVSKTPTRTNAAGGEPQPRMLRNRDENAHKATPEPDGSLPADEPNVTYHSSSVPYLSSKARPPTPGKAQSVQRWNSQPALAVSANTRSFKHQIKQARLLAARQAPTPPPVKTPILTQHTAAVQNSQRLSLNSVAVKDTSAVKSLQPLASAIRKRASTVTVQSSKPVIHSDPSQACLSPSTPRPALIYAAEPSEYWTGRFSALNDQQRNAELSRALPTALRPPSPVSSADITLPPHTCLEQTKQEASPQLDISPPAETSVTQLVRMRRSVETLGRACATDDACRAFRRWQILLADALAAPELAVPVRAGSGITSCGAEAMGLEDEVRDEKGLTGSERRKAGSGEIRKTSFIERLLGRGRKSLGST